MNAFERSVLNTVRQHHMIAPGQHVTIGLSGGADSTCLLMVLYVLRDELACTLSAVHVHHGLRESADLDETFCRNLCDRLGVPVTVVHADAARYAADHGESVEEAGRSIRYAAFREELARYETGGCIATAHHLEDLAETVLFNLCRGSGMAGLAGIQPVAGDVVRPLLYASRTEIEHYLTQREMTWCVDETNADTEITRNYLRREILPGLQEHVNAGTTEHLVRMAAEAAETEHYLVQETAAARQRCSVPGGISVRRLGGEPAILRRRIVRAMIVAAAGHSKDITAAHVQAVLRVCGSSHGTASVDLPYGLTAVRTYDTLAIRSADAADVSDAPGGRGTYRMHVFCREDGDQTILCRQYTKWFDYDRIGAFPVLRTRREGDVITIGGGVTKSLRRFMIDEKVPRDLRDVIEIPFAGNQALWIPGHQMNAAFKVTADTRNIVEIQYEPERSDGYPDESGVS